MTQAYNKPPETIRKEVPFKDLPNKTLKYDQIKAIQEGWGFDPSKPIFWEDNYITGVRVFKQYKDVTNGTETPPAGGD